MFLLMPFLLALSHVQSQPLAAISLDSIHLCINPYHDQDQDILLETMSFLSNRNAMSTVFDAALCVGYGSSYRFDFVVMYDKPMVMVESLSETYLTVQMSTYSTAVGDYGDCNLESTTKTILYTLVFELSEFSLEQVSHTLSKLSLKHPLNGTDLEPTPTARCKPEVNVTLYVTCENMPCGEMFGSSTTRTSRTTLASTSSSMQSSTSAGPLGSNNDVSLATMIAVSVSLVLLISLTLLCVLRLCQQMPPDKSTAQVIRQMIGFGGHRINTGDVQLERRGGTNNQSANNQLYTG